MEYRYMPPMAKLLSVVDSGGVGKIHMVHMREHR
jgi:predicted dehydrogenase